MLLKNGLDLTVAKAEKRDAVRILDYLNLVGGESDNLLFGRNGFSLDVAAEEQFIETVNASAASALLVGRIGEEIVSVASIQSPRRERIAHQADVALSVKKAHWGVGIGAAMMRAMIEFARSTGTIEIVHLGVRSDNVRAIELYKRLGFEQIGLYRKFFKIDGKYADEILMNLYLEDRTP